MPKSVPETEFYIAEVAAVNTTGCKILLPGETTAINKYYKTCQSVGVGDRVVAMKQSGTYVILGVVGAGAYVTSTLSRIATAASGFTLVDGKYAQSGNTAMLYLRFRPTTAITTTQEFKVATLVAGKRPPINAFVNYWANNGGEITPDGSVYAYGTATNTSNTYAVFSTYVLA